MDKVVEVQTWHFAVQLTSKPEASHRPTPVSDADSKQPLRSRWPTQNAVLLPRPATSVLEGIHHVDDLAIPR